jgi:hypothetical protein
MLWHATLGQYEINILDLSGVRRGDQLWPAVKLEATEIMTPRGIARADGVTPGSRIA